MVRGLRVVFSPDAISHAAYSHPTPGAGARGTITSVRLGGGLRTYVDGPGGGLVYVEWDDGLVCGIGMRDLKLEPDRDRRG
jgi:hypothetical protein